MKRILQEIMNKNNTSETVPETQHNILKIVGFYMNLTSSLHKRKLLAIFFFHLETKEDLDLAKDISNTNKTSEKEEIKYYFRRNL